MPRISIWIKASAILVLAVILLRHQATRRPEPLDSKPEIQKPNSLDLRPLEPKAPSEDPKRVEQSQRPSVSEAPDLPATTRYHVGSRFSLGGAEFWHLEFEGLPLLGFRLFGGSKKELPPEPQAPHSRSHTSQAAEKVREILEFRNCEVFSVKNAEDVFYRRSADHVVPAYAVEVYYLCGRDRKREQWILSDPDLLPIGTLPRKI